MGRRAETTGVQGRGAGQFRTGLGQRQKRQVAAAGQGQAPRPWAARLLRASRWADLASWIAARCRSASPSRSERSGPFIGARRSSAGSAIARSQAVSAPAGTTSPGQIVVIGAGLERVGPPRGDRKFRGAQRRSAARRSGDSVSTAATSAPRPPEVRTTGTPMRRSARARVRRSTMEGPRSMGCLRCVAPT